MKILRISLLVCLSFCFVAGCSSEGALEQEQSATQQELDQAVSENAEDTNDRQDVPDVEYVEVSINEMNEVLEDNPLKAEQEYQNAYITFKGYIKYDEILNTGDDAICFYVAEEINGEPLVCDMDHSFPEGENWHEQITIWGQVSSVYKPEDGDGHYSVDVLHYEFADNKVEDISYTKFTANELIDKYNEDQSKSEAKLYHTYVMITAPIRNIETEHFDFWKITGNTTTFSYGWIECIMTSDEQKAIIASKDLGDTVTVKGRITDMWYTLGTCHYEITVDSIE